MSFDWSVITENWPLLLQGAALTIALAVATMALAIPFGLLLAFMRMSPLAPVRSLATAFVEFFRTTPVMLQVYWVFYVLPVLVDFRVDAFSAGLLALTCNVSSFNSETFRSGINSIRAGQRNAGLALGMSEAQVMGLVILPQATQRVLPALASTWVSLSRTHVAGLGDRGGRAFLCRPAAPVADLPRARGAHGDGRAYWLMGYPQAKLTDWIHRRFKVTE